MFKTNWATHNKKRNNGPFPNISRGNSNRPINKLNVRKTTKHNNLLLYLFLIKFHNDNINTNISIINNNVSNPSIKE